MIVLAVNWIANPGKESEVSEFFRKLEAASRDEPGCLMYVVHQHRTDVRRFFIYEQYESDTALEAHRKSSHFQQYAVKGLKDIGVRHEAEIYIPLCEAKSRT